ncbi:MAG: ribokinase [Pseudomonadota bacterium]
MIFNLGSINADYFYDLPRLPGPGETLAATAMASGLGGKGANQSVAAARAGAEVCHIGAVGQDGVWAVKRLSDFGVDVGFVRESETATAHAIVMVDASGENQIVICPGANLDQSPEAVSEALASGHPGDWLMLQNETSHQADAAKLARAAGLNVAYSAAPFDVRSVEQIIPYTTLLIMNAVEADQFETATGTDVRTLPVDQVLITKGKEGAAWHDLRQNETISVPALPVDSIDTTGAGDTFVGYFIAGLSQNLAVQQALVRASAAAALSTTKKGTADAIPDLSTVLEFLRD